MNWTCSLWIIKFEKVEDDLNWKNNLKSTKYNEYQLKVFSSKARIWKSTFKVNWTSVGKPTWAWAWHSSAPACYYSLFSVIMMPPSDGFCFAFRLKIWWPFNDEVRILYLDVITAWYNGYKVITITILVISTIVHIITQRKYKFNNYCHN